MPCSVRCVATQTVTCALAAAGLSCSAQPWHWPVSPRSAPQSSCKRLPAAQHTSVFKGPAACDTSGLIGLKHKIRYQSTEHCPVTNGVVDAAQVDLRHACQSLRHSTFTGAHDSGAILGGTIALLCAWSAVLETMVLWTMTHLLCKWSIQVVQTLLCGPHLPVCRVAPIELLANPNMRSWRTVMQQVAR